MDRYDMLTVDILSATFQTSQLGEGMLCYRLTESGRLVTSRGFDLAYHGLLHLIGEDGAEFMAIFTHGRLESLDPILEQPRQAAGLTQAAVAAHFGRPQSFVSKCESGERRIDPTELQALSRLYEKPHQHQAGAGARGLAQRWPLTASAAGGHRPAGVGFTLESGDGHSPMA